MCLSQSTLSCWLFKMLHMQPLIQGHEGALLHHQSSRERCINFFFTPEISRRIFITVLPNTTQPLEKLKFKNQVHLVSFLKARVMFTLFSDWSTEAGIKVCMVSAWKEILQEKDLPKRASSLSLEPHVLLWCEGTKALTRRKLGWETAKAKLDNKGNSSWELQDWEITKIPSQPFSAKKWQPFKEWHQTAQPMPHFQCELTA